MSYARYYTFTLTQDSAVTIDLQSSLDTYLFLREEEARSGDFLHENDDVDRDGRDYDSRIVAMLAARTYTIEATTYNAAQAGSFTLTVTGLVHSQVWFERDTTVGVLFGRPGFQNAS